MSQEKLKSIAKEIAFGMIILFVVSNVLSYIRQPTLSSSHLPPLETTLIDGQHFKLEEGKPWIIHFWATWCPTCRLEAPNIDALSREYNIVTIAVNSGNDEALKAFMKENRLDFRVINDIKGELANRFKIEAYPTTFIYDSHGELHFGEVGYTSTLGLLGRLKLLE